MLSSRRPRWFLPPLAASALLVSALAPACRFQGFGPRHVGSGVASEERRASGDFDELRLDVPATVEVHVGSAASITVRGDDNLLALLETRVQDNTLIVDLNGGFSTELGLKVVLTTPALRRASIRGSGAIRIDGLGGESFEASISGSGDIQAAGDVGRLVAGISGSGDLRMLDLTAQSVEVDISGSGDAAVHAEAELDVRISGSGHVSYRGAATPEVRISGSGGVSRAAPK